MPQLPDDPELPEDPGLTEAETGLKLPARCVTTVADDLRVQLVLASASEGGIEIDASEVENVGQAVLQLLAAAKADADANGLRFVITNPSPAFAERAVACRLGDAIGLSLEEESVSWPN